MWKSTTGHDIKNPVQSSEDDDWNTDPDFVNDVDEKNQRWGNQKTVETGGTAKTDVDMNELRKNVVDQHEEKIKDDWKKKAQESKGSYGVGKTPGKV